MASLQKIRNHGAALITVVGLAMLAFIMGDFLNSGSSFFNRNRENIATISGQNIHYTEYQNAVDQLQEVYKIETGRNDFDEDMSAQLRQQVWQMLVADYTLRAEGEKIGMDVTNAELSELCIGQNPHQIIRGRRAFYDQTGQFNRNALVQFLASLEQEPENAEQQANLQQAKTYWLYWEKATRLTYMQEKYVGLLQSLVRANKLDAKYAFDARQTSANVAYVMQPYYAVADSLVKVSNSDIKKLYNQKKAQYKQTPNRAIAYITFPVVASEDDYNAAKTLMESITEEFKTTEDVALVVNTNSDLMYDGRDYSINTIPERYKDFAFAKGAKAGDFMPLSFENGVFAMARIVEAGYSKPDSVELKAIAAQEGQEDVELGWFEATDLQASIAGPAFSGKKGTRFTVAQGLGEQTFEILEVSPATPKVKVAIIEREVTASSQTYSILYNQAKQFIVNNPSEEKFTEGAMEAGLTVTPQYNLTANTDKVGQLKSSRAIVRWAFEAKEGAVSDVFECGEQFVVATLTEVNDGEYRSLEQVRPELTVEATTNAKANYIIKNMKGATTLEEAAKIAGVEVQEAENVTLAGVRFGNQGAEPAVIGAALAQAENAISAPIQGNAGVYVVKTLAKVTAEGEFNAEAEQQQLSSRYAYTLPYQALNLLQDKVEITDNRANFQ